VNDLNSFIFRIARNKARFFVSPKNSESHALSSLSTTLISLVHVI